jgi:hypothetical protein
MRISLRKRLNKVSYFFIKKSEIFIKFRKVSGLRSIEYIKERGKEQESMPRTRTVDVSFKKTTRDMKLYTTVIAKEEKSDFVKDAIEFYIEYLEEKQKNKSIQNA